TAWPGYDESRRRGYFSISENDPNDPTDDVLAFTVITPKNGSQSPYFGQTVMLIDKDRAETTIADGGPGLTWPAPKTEPQRAQWFQAYMAAYPNQLEFDDGNPVSNGTGTSRAAEIVYFLRNGNLYRRVLLLRDPYNQDGETLVPVEVKGEYRSATGVSGFFGEDFSYSGFHKFAGGSQAALWIHSVDESLKNLSDSKIVSDINVPASLGIPHLRFGYSPSNGSLPREYIGSGSSRKFIGRWLHRETADKNFLYPGRIKTPIDNNDPHKRNDLTDSNNDGVVDQYSSNTTRRGEDILMTNVHEFDIKVWDAELQKFVDLGHTQSGTSGKRGHYHRQNNRDSGVRNGTNWDWNRYDTWHPFRHPTSNWDLGKPPYRPTVDNKSTQLGDSANEIPLRAIQITIRFYDVSTARMRQLTIVHSLIGKPE
ncbi:MAG: hypothetical protein IID45_10755, partial [Planctomycetes bacterium]|nr:hypothetical protein [Planctomycetota bacterium]